MIEADTVAHCGPTMIGEFARTLTMTDVVSGWTENHAIRNNASKWILEGIEQLQQRFRYPMVIFVESQNNHVVRKNPCYWRHDTPDGLELLNRLRQLVSLPLNFFTPTK
ncbi:hypothetical protein B1987_28870 [Mycobacterium kansasii]|uniref:Uncharacterized protein n=1 Tax=Mycobacterium attenuatum TaxID=2341086 RepID=A0A498QB40_9MYCO|nr:hypothetical protein [Mycobacterium attenuatum]ORB82225.1 hypothetical protein B1987_28870 [Mycobacterium kansasii]VBA43488.1 hypothetical protein LAUMK136_05110 [Mycobacterium attenuatum]